MWLVRFKADERKDRVYALKILRKADGESGTWLFCGKANVFSLSVIKLKQVEHVRSERRTLAAVSGHPFITSLIASFSDAQSLYMLVWIQALPLGPNHAAANDSSAGLLSRRRDI